MDKVKIRFNNLDEYMAWSTMVSQNVRLTVHSFAAENSFSRVIDQTVEDIVERVPRRFLAVIRENEIAIRVWTSSVKKAHIPIESHLHDTHSSFEKYCKESAIGDE